MLLKLVALISLTNQSCQPFTSISLSPPTLFYLSLNTLLWVINLTECWISSHCLSFPSSVISICKQTTRKHFNIAHLTPIKELLFNLSVLINDNTNYKWSLGVLFPISITIHVPFDRKYVLTCYSKSTYPKDIELKTTDRIVKGNTQDCWFSTTLMSENWFSVGWFSYS